MRGLLTYWFETYETLVDAVAMEDSDAIWVADDAGRLVFVEMTGDLIHWDEPGHVFPVSNSTPVGLHARQPRLASWGSRLFASRDNNVHVVARLDCASPDFAVTATVQRAPGGGIADISIGGDRLFVAHKESASFEVWDTPIKRGTSLTGAF